ncbi:hypothetical protein VTJ83DRAFT_423 [Remersonia thermophila]|uniref:Uncharacterized protein n=1 Tax=Remersonia thermophila TaxID=72144 RepID=A0ABR4DMN8_9PEZI
MLRRTALTLARSAARPSLYSTMASPSPTAPAPAASLTPIEDAIREKLTAALQPSHLEIHNDSHLHAHHAAMRSFVDTPSVARETHFRLTVASAAFRGKPQPARHRLVYSLLRDEMAREGGVHALQLRTVTPEELEARRRKEEEEGGAVTCKGDKAAAKEGES